MTRLIVRWFLRAIFSTLIIGGSGALSFHLWVGTATRFDEKIAALAMVGGTILALVQFIEDWIVSDIREWKIENLKNFSHREAVSDIRSAGADVPIRPRISTQPRA